MVFSPKSVDIVLRTRRVADYVNQRIWRSNDLRFTRQICLYERYDCSLTDTARSEGTIVGSPNPLADRGDQSIIETLPRDNDRIYRHSVSL